MYFKAHITRHLKGSYGTRINSNALVGNLQWILSDGEEHEFTMHFYSI